MAEHEASPRIPSAPLPWWVWVCRWLWRRLGFVWGTLIVGIVIATIANLNTTTTDTPLARLYIVHLVQTYPIPVWSGLGLLTALTLLSWLGSRDKQAMVAHPLSKQDRVHMLRRLRVRYEQLRAQSLQGAVQLELGLAERPAAVQNAVSLSLRLPAQPERPLPANTSIVQAYELAQQELLILGEPGAGKSTLLVELARTLLAEAEQDATLPFPILLPLASWAERQHPLDEWLSEEIARLYDAPRRLSQHWVQAEQVLPLLDGLDEMEEAARPACVAAINAYHHKHLRPLVVCSRTSEYDAATKHEQLALHTAVVVQPLERRQVDAYLASLGKPLAELRTALKTNVILQELATTSLMVQVLMLTYRGTSVRTLPQKAAQLREQIWTDYVQRMVERKGDVKRYPLAVTTGWLRWLASEMRQRNQTIFLLETLQPDWLPVSRRKRYRWSDVLVFGLLGGLVFGPLGGLGVGPLAGLLVGLLAVLVVGLLAWLLVGEDAEVRPAEILTWSWKKFWPGLFVVLVFGLLAGLVFGLVFGLLAWLHAGLHAGLLSGLVVGLLAWLLVGLLGGLVGGFSGEQLTERLMLSPNEGVHRSLKNGLVSGLLGGLVVGLILGLVVGLVSGLLSGLTTAALF